MPNVEIAVGALWSILALVLVILALLFALLVFWVWGIIDCIVSRLPTEQKIIWIVLMVLFPVLATVVYLLFRKPGDVVMAKKNTAKTAQKTAAKSPQKRLTRSRTNRMIGGVCGGIGEYLDVDPTIVRLLWVVLTLLSVGAGIIAYLIAWLIIPQE